MCGLMEWNRDAGSTSGTSEMTTEERKEEEALHSGSLRVPRRPPWNAEMSVEELDDNEKQAFLLWRRSLARFSSFNTGQLFSFGVCLVGLLISFWAFNLLVFYLFQARGKWEACSYSFWEEPWYLETTLACSWTQWLGKVHFLLMMLRVYFDLLLVGFTCCSWMYE